MSKHLRFGRLFSMLAVMLTLSFAWSQAQNLHSEKQLLTFGFTVAANPGAQLGSDVMVTIPASARAATITVPYQTNVTALIASFTSSPFTNVFGGQVSPALPLSVSGVSPALNYTLPVTWTVEAENHSYENYVITVSKAAASSAKDLTSFSGAWTKAWANCGTHGDLAGTAAGSFAGTNVSISVPYGANLDAITVSLGVSTFASCVPASGAIVDFDANNDGIPNAVTFTVTAQNGSTQAYSVLPVVGPVSLAKSLLGMSVPGSISVTLNPAVQTISIVMPYSAASWSPNFQVSDFAHTYSSLGPDVNWCQFAPVALDGNKLTADNYNFWIRAEQTSETSLWTISVTNAVISPAKDVLAPVTANYTKTWGHVACPQSESVTGMVGSLSGTTITYTVPYGVTSITLTSVPVSSLATVITPAALPAVITPDPSPGAYEIVVRAEDGTTKGYDVVLVTSPGISGNKDMIEFGFHKVQNDPWAFPNWSTDYACTIDHTLKLITVSLPWNTDLHDLIAYFRSSLYSSVFIAETNLAFTPQCSDVTVNDHSNSLTYMVRAEDGTQERWQLIVTRDNGLTGKDITGFSMTIPYCFGGSAAYSTAPDVVISGTNIAVSLKYGTVVGNVPYSLGLSPGASVNVPNPGVGIPSSITVTSQSGATQTYTVTVTTRLENSAKKILTYGFKSADNAALGGADVWATINATTDVTKILEVWVPWEARTGVNNLKATFTLSDRALMTHSEDGQVQQFSGITPLDFTDPVAYTVWAENCSTVEYFVTVKVIPNVNTGISAFEFASVGCICDPINNIDPYARRINITLPYTMDITNLAPSSVVVTPGASVVVANTNPVQPWSTAKDWTKGPITYTVTAPDGVTKANWTVQVSNPPCKESDITGWSFASGQVGSAVISTDNHTVDITVANGTNLRNMTATIGLSCGATICCNMGACAGTTIDFSDNLCHTCVITAQDQTITQDWTVCLHYQDIVKPNVTTWSVMAYNCTDSVAVQSNELGRVFIVNESAINMLATPSPVVTNYNLADWTGTTSVATSVASLVAARLGNWATVTAVNTPVYVSTHGLYNGTYWAFAVDASGNISCISTQKLYLDICDVTVATLCDLRAQPLVWRYTLTEEIYVTYEENHAGGNWKFLQNATCGILVEDQLGALPATAYGVGAGITGLKGMLNNSGIALKLIPVCCYQPTKSSIDNTVTPIDVTFDNFGSVQANLTYESMLVRISTPIIAGNDYGQGPNWTYDNLDLHTMTPYSTQYYVQSALNSPLIGTAVPTYPAYYTGIRTNILGGYWPTKAGLITPRKAADIVPVSGPILTYKPNPVMINGVLPGQCKGQDITIYNQGATLVVNNVTISGVANITALYLDDSPASDEFNLVLPPAVPFQIQPWPTAGYSKVVRVEFCPVDLGAESTNLIVEYGLGKTLVIPINGTTPLIYDMPYLQEFKYAAGPPELWAAGGDFNAYTNYTGWACPTAATAVGGVVIAWYSNWVYPYGGFVDGNRSIFMRPRGGNAGAPYIYPVAITTPGFKITGTDPVVSFVETAWWALHTSGGMHAYGVNPDPRTLSISEDGVSWTPIRTVRADGMSYETDVVASYTNPTYDQVIVSLSNYIGKTVYFRFDLGLITGKYVYWIIDQFEVKERVTTPIISVSPGAIDFGGVQLGATGTSTVTVRNTGISVVKVKKVEIQGASFSLVDTNTYPFEVNASTGYAYSIGNNGSSLSFTVNFSPTDIGVKTGKVIITWGLYGDQVTEIPLTGEGLSCYTAAVANKGENWAPSQNVWFKYTADKFSIVEVNSCHVHQQIAVAGEYSWDTFLYLYKDCEGTLIGSHDDMEGACVYNRTSSSVQTVVNAGETIYIFWPLAFPASLHAFEGFYFNVNVTYPTDGDVCENAIPLTLPVVNHFGTTNGFNDDYDQSPCSPFSNYMDGNDKVYTITLAEEGYLIGNILGAYGSIHVLDVCPKEELTKDHCKAYTGGPNGGQFRKKIAAGTYYVIISTWAPPQTVDYLLNMSWESSSAVENGDLMSNLSVFPNPTSGKFTVSISNAEATDMTLELVNITGQVVYRNEVKAAYSYNDEIDASQFAKGVYYLKVNNGKEVKIEKIVVE